jgi:hypothetical protein
MIALAGSLIGNAEAATISITVTGVLDAASANFNALGANVEDPFTVQMLYPDSLPDQNPTNPENGIFSPHTMHVTLGVCRRRLLHPPRVLPDEA